MLRRVLFIASSAIIVLLFAVQAAVHWPKRQSAGLTVDQVLAWRLPYNDLIGADEKVVVEKFGPPDRKIPNWISYFGGGKSQSRKIDLLIENGIVKAIRVFATPQDFLGIEQVIQRAPVFCFSSGTFTDSTVRYFSAQSVDGRDVLQFSINDRSARFHAVMFENEGASCDPRKVALAEE
jgi:hypothetical protein